MVVDVGTGTSIAFLTSAFVAELVGLSHSGIAREEIETSHMGTAVAAAGKIGSRTFRPGDLSDPGELKCDIHFNPDQVVPVEKVAEQIKVTFPVPAGLTTGAIWQCEGFVKSLENQIPLEGKMTATITIKLSGQITITPAA